MAPEYLRIAHLSVFTACESPFGFAQTSSSFTEPVSNTKLLAVCVLFFSSLPFVSCCAELRACSSSTFTSTRPNLWANSSQPIKEALLYTGRPIDSAGDTLSIDSNDGHTPHKETVSTSEKHSPLHRDLYSTASTNSQDQRRELLFHDKLHLNTPPNGQDYSSDQGRSVFLKGDTTHTSDVKPKHGFAPMQKRALLIPSEGRRCTTDIHEKGSPPTATISAIRRNSSRALREGQREGSHASRTWRKQRRLQDEALASSSSASGSPAHPGVSVLGRVGQNAEINGEYKLEATDPEKGFLFKKVLRTYSEGTPLYLFSSGHAPLQRTEQDGQQLQQRSSPGYWAIGEVPYVNEKIRAFALSDAAHPDLITGTWSVFEQQNNETVLVPDKFVVVVLVGCNNGALDGDELGMDCGGSCDISCQSRRSCQLPRALPAGYALGSCPLDGVLHHGEGCNYKCPLGWKESGALGRVCYDGTLLEVRRGAGCEEAFSSAKPDAERCQFLLLQGAPSQKARGETHAARALEAAAEVTDAAGNEAQGGGGSVGVSLLPTRGIQRTRRSGKEQKETEEPKVAALPFKAAAGGRAQDELGGGVVAQGKGGGAWRIAAGEPAESLGGHERARGERRKIAKKARTRDLAVIKGNGRQHRDGIGEEVRDVASPAPASTSETADTGECRGERPISGRRKGTKNTTAAATRGATGLIPGGATRREAAVATLQDTEAEAPPDDVLKGRGEKTEGNFTEDGNDRQPHVCNGLFIMHAVRGASGQRAVFWQRDADGVLVQLYWEDGYWVCASFDKDAEYGYVWDPFPSRLVQGNNTNKTFRAD